jgi:hypothetical protein
MSRNLGTWASTVEKGWATPACEHAANQNTNYRSNIYNSKTANIFTNARQFTPVFWRRQ